MPEDGAGNHKDAGLDDQSSGGVRKKRFGGFKRDPQACLFLLREVLKRRPFSYGNVGPGWAQVTENLAASNPMMFPLSATDGQAAPCSAESCRTAFERIFESWVRKGKMEDGINDSMSGYDHTEWNAILNQIDELIPKTKKKSKGGSSIGADGGGGGTPGVGKRARASAPLEAATLEPKAHNQISAITDPSAIDMRSDTVTRPTPAMRLAISEAIVGDDVFGDDPSVRELEACSARIFDKAAALFVPSGTMANLIAIMSHCEARGCEMILGSLNHIVVYEQGGAASIAGVMPRVIPTQIEPGSDTPVGGISLKAIDEAIRVDDVHFPVTRLVCLENTHNLTGGTPLPAEYVDSVGQLCRQRGLKLHVDGARIFNAATALGVTVARLCRSADSVSVCLSKGLASPVGSLLIGPEDFVRRARRHRKALGGGMRQSGMLAVCGLLSLSSMSKRLAEDHGNAKRLAIGLSQIQGLMVNPNMVHTNIIYFSLLGGGAQNVVKKLKEKGVLMIAKDDTTIRAVLHYMIPAEAVEYVVKCMRDIIISLHVDEGR